MVRDVIVRVSSMPVGKTPGQFGEWLRQELTERGYDLQRGGQSRFAREAGLDVSIINRVLKSERVPEVDALRRIGKALAYTLGEMLVFAGLAAAEELPVRAQTGTAGRVANGTATLPDLLSDLRASAEAEGKTIGELLVERGLAAEDELVIPTALPPDPIIAEIEAAADLTPETKEVLIRLHLANRAQRFEEARLAREKGKRRDE